MLAIMLFRDMVWPFLGTTTHIRPLIAYFLSKKLVKAGHEMPNCIIDVVGINTKAHFLYNDVYLLVRDLSFVGARFSVKQMYNNDTFNRAFIALFFFEIFILLQKC